MAAFPFKEVGVFILALGRSIVDFKRGDIRFSRYRRAAIPADRIERAIHQIISIFGQRFAIGIGWIIVEEKVKGMQLPGRAGGAAGAPAGQIDFAALSDTVYLE